MPLILIALIAMVGAGVGWLKFGTHCGCPYSQKMPEPSRMMAAVPEADGDLADVDWKVRCRAALEQARDGAATSMAPGLRDGNVSVVTLFADEANGGQAFVEYELVRPEGGFFQVSIAEETDEGHLGLNRWSRPYDESLGAGNVRRRQYLHRNGLLVSLHGEGDSATVDEFGSRFQAAVDACTGAN